jgi:hypothetical protein
MRHRLTVGLFVSLCTASAASAAEVAAEAMAGAKLAIAKKPSCKEDSERDCIPADVVTYAPFDLRIGRWDLDGTTREFEPTQFTVGINPDMTIHALGATTRSTITASLGGGDSGFEWTLGGIWRFGGRLSLGQGKHGGPFARIGVDAYMGGNSDYYRSHLELPRFELGYQLIKTNSLFLEAAGRGGLMLTGRRRIFDRTRDIGFSLDAGGMLTLQMPFLRLHVDVVRIYEDDHAPESPIDRGQLDVCGILSQLALCLTASADRGEIFANGQDVDTRGDFIGGKLAFTNAEIARMEF